MAKAFGLWDSTGGALAARVPCRDFKVDPQFNVAAGWRFDGGGCAIVGRSLDSGQCMMQCSKSETRVIFREESNMCGHT